MGQITVGGTAVQGQQPQDNPLTMGVYDGTNERLLKGDTAGRPQISGAAAGGSAIAGNPVYIGGTDGSNAQGMGVNTVNQVLVNTEGRKATYSASVANFTPVATPTDFFSITGSGSKIIRVLGIRISGVATSGTIVNTRVVKRSTANSGGSPSSLTAVAHESSQSAATAVVATYGVNPTTGTLVGAMHIRKHALVTDASNIVPQLLDLEFGQDNGKAIVLSGTTEVLALNWNGDAVPSGTALDIEITWTEE